MTDTGDLFDGWEMERICFNCNAYFPAERGLTDFGLCLNDPEFEPYLDALLDDFNFECCRELIQRKRFEGDRPACEDFEHSEIVDIDEFKDINIQNIEFDIKTLPIDSLERDLASPDEEKRSSALRSLQCLASAGNAAAADLFIGLLKDLPPPKHISEVHYKIRLLEEMPADKSKDVLIPLLIDELYNMPSNNTTRQWINCILRYFSRCPVADVEPHLEKMLKDKRFTYRMKNKIKNILYADVEDDFSMFFE